MYVFATTKIRQVQEILHLIPAPPQFYHQISGDFLKIPKFCWLSLKWSAVGRSGIWCFTVISYKFVFKVLLTSSINTGYITHIKSSNYSTRQNS